MFLRLLVRAWPTGEGRVEFEAIEKDGGCYLVMREHAVKGSAALLPGVVIDPVLSLRNTETLRRLRLMVEGRRT